MRRLLHLSAALALLGLAGCVQSSMVIHVKADGSGTLVERNVFNGEKVKQMRAVKAEPGTKLYSEAEVRNKAESLGEGVTCTQVEDVLLKDGSAGYQATYSFKDVAKLHFATRGASAGTADKNADKICFEFAKQSNGAAVLTVTLPDAKLPEGAPPAPKPVTDEEANEMLFLVKGLKYTLALEVEGTVVRTNSPYQEGNRVTVMQLDMDQVQAQPGALKLLMSTRELPAAEQARLLKDVKGLRLPPGNKVTVEFKP